MVRRNTKRMNQANNWIVFVRGNHDNPAYFEGTTFSYKRFIAVPDYTILQACNHSILCVGGAISIDRIYRINEWNKRKYRVHSNELQENDISRNLYWKNEAPIYDADKMNTICASFLIDTVVILRHHIVSYSQKATLTNGLRTIHHFLKMYNLKEKQWI